MIEFRPLAREDVPLVLEWRRRPHVARWWRDQETLEEAEATYFPRVAGDDPVDVYLIELDGRPVGMIQTFRLSDHPADWHDAAPGVSGVDVLIGEEELTGRGLGPDVLRAFVRDVVFADPSVVACVADPEAANRVSIRAFEKAGFACRGTFDRPEEGTTHQLVRLDR